MAFLLRQTYHLTMRRSSDKFKLVFVFILAAMMSACGSLGPAETASENASNSPSKNTATASAEGALAYAGVEKGTGNRRSETSVALSTPGKLMLDDRLEKKAELKFENVSVHNLSKTMEFSSTVLAPTDRSGVVTSLIHGVVTRVLADVGDSVKAGQVLAYVSSPELADMQSNYLSTIAKVKEATAQVQQIKVKLELAKAQVERLKMLNKEGITSVKDLQTSEGNIATLLADQAAVKAQESAALSFELAARARLRSLGIATENFKDNSITNELALKSPITGVVVDKTVSPGQSIGPSIQGTAGSGTAANVFTIADLSTVWVMLEVPQAEVAAIKLNTSVIFKSEVAPNQVFHGRVTRLGQNFDPNSRTVAVRTEIANPKLTLKPGMLILATVLLDGGGRNVLSVPVKALQQIDSKNVVFVKTGQHQFAVRPVVLGERTADYAEVKNGLQSNETVVTDGSFALKSEAMRATIGGQ